MFRDTLTPSKKVAENVGPLSMWPDFDAEWFEGPKRKQRKRRSDAGSSKKWAPNALFERVPEYVDVNDLDGGFGENHARSASAGCADQRREADTRMDSPARSPDQSMPSQEEMDDETSSSGRAPEQRRPSNPAKPIADLHELTSKQIMDEAPKHLAARSETADSDGAGKAEGG
jgi:hypothetical protein